MTFILGKNYAGIMMRALKAFTRVKPASIVGLRNPP
jgi:hypothetical protein